MAERKVQNRYYGKRFNHEKLVKVRKAENKQHNVRMMLPFSIKCDTCGNYFKAGTKINMRKETCLNEDYLGISVFRLYMKCIICYSEMSMKTDPKNHDYTMEHGATRMYEAWKDYRAIDNIIKEVKENEEEGNNMKTLEHKTYDAKKEMDQLERIKKLKKIKLENARTDIDQVIKNIQNYQKQEIEVQCEQFIAKQKQLQDNKLEQQIKNDNKNKIIQRNKKIFKIQPKKNLSSKFIIKKKQIIN